MRKGRNINRLSITRGLSAEGLGPPKSWLIAIAKKTLGFRSPGLSPELWLLMPTFSLPIAPPDALRPGFSANRNAPLPPVK